MIDTAVAVHSLSGDPARRLGSAEARAAFAALLIEAQEQQWRSVSEELHDNLCQRLAVLSMAVGKLETLPLAEAAQDLIRRMRSDLQELASDVRSMAHRMHPSVPGRLGLEPSLRYCCAEFEQRSEIRVRFLSRNLSTAVPGGVALCLYRVLQEALMNIWKHSGTQRCAVALSASPAALRLVVSDKGRGFDSASNRPRGLGLVTMEERVRMTGGQVVITSGPGKGTQIHVQIPVSV
jgi:signal transduction histidine kinase